MESLPPGNSSIHLASRQPPQARFFPAGKTRGNRRVAVLFNLQHFFRIRLGIACSEGKESR
jgi:hypothetical protein